MNKNGMGLATIDVMNKVTIGATSGVRMRSAAPTGTIGATRLRELTVRQIDNAIAHTHRLEELLAGQRERLRTARYRLGVGDRAASINVSGGADLDMKASQLARALDRLMVLIDVTYSAEEGVTTG